MPNESRSSDDRAAVGTTVLTVDRDGVHHRHDVLAAEAPLEVRVVTGDGRRHPIAVTMRTPGHDRELAAGFLWGEGVIARRAAIASIEGGDRRPEAPVDHVVSVFLAPEVPFDAERFRRNVYLSSSCGICGRASIERVRLALPGPPLGETALERSALIALPQTLRASQTVFARTGGLHAAALFDAAGRLRLMREDVGRHNAVDKVVGALLLAGRLPASDSVLLVSGRASYELVQKALMAGVSTLAAVGAPSSLAVELARAFDLTLIGFLRDDRFNVYTAPRRVDTASL